MATLLTSPDNRRAVLVRSDSTAHVGEVTGKPHFVFVTTPEGTPRVWMTTNREDVRKITRAYKSRGGTVDYTPPAKRK